MPSWSEFVDAHNERRASKISSVVSPLLQTHHIRLWDMSSENRYNTGGHVAQFIRLVTVGDEFIRLGCCWFVFRVHSGAIIIFSFLNAIWIWCILHWFLYSSRFYRHTWSKRICLLQPTELWNHSLRYSLWMIKTLEWAIILLKTIIIFFIKKKSI